MKSENWIKDIKAIGQVEKIDEYTNSVGYSERTDAVVEPRLSMQWYVKMKDLCDHLLMSPSKDTPRIQETHILMGHIICQLIEEQLFKSNT